MNKKIIWNGVGLGINIINRITFPLQKNNGKVLRFDTSIGTDNLGDEIIMFYCNQTLDELFPECRYINIGTHLQPIEQEERIVKQIKYKFVCGTNLLTSNIEEHWRWCLPDGIRRKLNYRNVILLGVGWGEYQDECSNYSRMVYRCILNPTILHSVRDEYTLLKLQRAGIHNVINTGCPTTWRLNREFCRSIPRQKAKEVITTITDYRRNQEKDNQMLQILSRNYDRIHLWLQGRYDEEYLNELSIPDNVVVIPASLKSYEEVLKKRNVDYVGTRLHAGIHALNYRIRSIIIAVDNRAIEMGRDINLPVVQREQIGEKLEKYVNSEFGTYIHINQKNIDCFRAQFRRK